MKGSDSEYILIWAKRLKSIKKLGEKCKICGNSNIFHLEFHHENAIDKNIDVSRIMSYRWSIIEKEIEKCILLCRNCHLEQHWVENKNLIKQKLLIIKGVSACSKCGYSKNNVCLDFHHIYDKKFAIARGYKNERMSLPIETIILELDKCEVLCRNCHGEFRINKEKFNRLKNEINKKIDNYIELPPKIDRKEISQLHKIGYGVTEISKMLGCAKSTVCMALKSAPI